MRRIVCFFRGHRRVRVAVGPAGLMVMPGYGLVCHFTEDENGDHEACQFCRQVFGRVAPEEPECTCVQEHDPGCYYHGPSAQGWY